MGWLDGAIAPENLFRRTVSGERVYAPIGARGALYRVSDTAADRLQREIRIHLVLATVTAALGAPFAVDRWGWFPVIAAIAVDVPAFRWWLRRGLPRVRLRREDLRPVDQRTLALQAARATGPSALRWMLVSSIFWGTLGLLDALS